MRTLAFDGRMGASGDMLLGALIDAGGDPDALGPIEDTLDVKFSIESGLRSGIDAVDVQVHLSDEHDDEHGDEHDDHRGSGHQHHNHHQNDHAAHHEEHETAEGSGPVRSYEEVVELVESIDLPSSVIEEAVAIFERLGRAEATIHGSILEDIHFHEVGADDAIADVTGTVTLLADLDAERIVTTPVATGGGTVEMAHGVYPVPTPAVVELAEEADWQLRGGPVEAELLTPTGAAILAHVATGVDSLPDLSVESSGYGAGDRRYSSHPNVLRAIIGTSAADLAREPISVLETNVDDVTPEVLGGLQDSLQSVGARDVSILPTTMKKSRPGHLVRVVVRPEDVRPVARQLAAETGTLGIRAHGRGHRFVADREQTTVTLDVDGEAYDVGVKFGRFGDEGGEGPIFDVSAEFDDARAVATATGWPTRRVLEEAERLAREQRADSL